MINYEEVYNQNILSKYGKLRQDDNLLLLNNNYPHQYSILNRKDMTDKIVYTIDPEGCKDADDAFSIYNSDNKLFLAIHIADPTEYININSDLWKDIIGRTTTKYPSNRKPIHMMPEKILEISSLMTEDEMEVKKCISILTQINEKTFEPMGKIKLLFSKILIRKENSFTYAEAAESNKFEIGLKISKSLINKRSNVTKGTVLSELSIANIIYDEDKVFLKNDNIKEKLMKQMIAEFAIFANSFVGEFLKINLGQGIFRTCNAKEWLDKTSNNITGEEMIQEIITNGITADYMSNIESHDLVGIPEYCHFTSPIRRLSDCICHYLLKHIYLENSKCPFTNNDLDQLSSKCLLATKNDKKNQYLDIKFRLIQVMANLIELNGKINLEYYITGYSGLFLNLIINKIDNFNVHMAYSLRIKNYTKEFIVKEKKSIEISIVNCLNKFDQGTIPQLDSNLLQ